MKVEEWDEDGEAEDEDDREVDLTYALATVAAARVTRTWLEHAAVHALDAQGWDEADLVARVLAGEPGDADPEATRVDNKSNLEFVVPRQEEEPDSGRPSVAGRWRLADGRSVRVEVEIGEDEDYAEYRQARAATAYVFVD